MDSPGTHPCPDGSRPDASWWEARVVPRLVEASLDNRHVAALREDVCRDLRGRTLEVGFGSGLNVAHYPPAMTSLDVVEPSDRAWEMSAARRAEARVPVERVGLDGQSLAAADGVYDAALSTFTLCTVPDPVRMLAELRRVLRPDGVLVLLEHGLAPSARVRRWQRRIEPLQRRVAGGCHLTRDVPALLDRAGLVVDHLDAAYLPGPAPSRPWSYVHRARAHPPVAQ